MPNKIAVGTLGILVNLCAFASVDIEVDVSPVDGRDTRLVHQPEGCLFDLRCWFRNAIRRGTRHAQHNFLGAHEAVVAWERGVVIGQCAGRPGVHAAMVRTGTVIHSGVVNHTFTVIDHRHR